MFKEFGLATIAFAVGFALVFYNVPVITSTLTLITAPLAGHLSGLFMGILPQIDQLKTFVTQNWQLVLTLTAPVCMVTGYVINYLKNRQMLNMQKENNQIQRDLETKLINSGNLNTQLQTSHSELEAKAKSMSEKLDILESVTQQIDGTKTELRTEMDNNLEQLRSELNFVLKRIDEVDKKKVPVYVP